MRATSQGPCEPCSPLGIHKDVKKKNVSSLSYWTEAGSRYELEYCYNAISKMAGLHAGVRVLAYALLARTELCLAVGHPGHCRIQSGILGLHSLDAGSANEF